MSKEETKKFLHAKQYFRRQYMPNSTEAPLLSVMDTLLTQEQNAAAAISLLALDGRQDNETYRWPLREDLIPIVPKTSSVHFPAEPDAFEQQGMGFVDELTGVPKEEDDYSDSDTDINRDSSGDGDSADEARQEFLLKQRRLAKQRRARHANERLANDRLEQVHSLLNSEFVAFAHRQYRKGTKERIQDLDAFQRETLPPFRIRAARASIGRSKGGDEQEDEMTPIQEKAVSFAAEDSLRKILDRLPYVIRQGALGELPDYVRLGLPKPVTSVADYERNWDTIMTAASIGGVEDRILKKVGVRMKELLSISEQSRYYEAPPRGSFARGEDSDETEPESDGSEADRVQIKPPVAQTASAKEVWREVPKPLHLAREFVDALDPKFSAEARVRNAQRRREWLCKDTAAGVIRLNAE
ncbi:hypothetical protein BGZ58_002887 [Dissophora ornata]|nr:hypothetical protein BGZ58_002887 [Dissophora ornata]